ncbi:hypothetical protein MHBO_005277 [Bonamia ostreae]|uniref:Phage protein n=1 Tax=Bonamia ostreae TaxID=126728 RepID=A0ABV2AVF8_9EUKA
MEGRIKIKPAFRITIRCIDEGDYKDTTFERKMELGVVAENCKEAIQKAADIIALEDGVNE